MATSCRDRTKNVTFLLLVAAATPNFVCHGFRPITWSPNHMIIRRQASGIHRDCYKESPASYHSWFHYQRQKLSSHKRKRSRTANTTGKKPTTSSAVVNHGDNHMTMVKGLVKNLFSICAHIQNPDLYSASNWADRVTLVANNNSTNNDTTLVTSCSIRQGDILSLYPLDALGLRTSNSQQNTPNKSTKVSPTTNQAQRVRDFVVFDADQNGDYFNGQLANLMTQSHQPLLDNHHYRVSVPFTVTMEYHDNTQNQHYSHDLFVDVNPTKIATPGWRGHLAFKQQQQQQQPSTTPPSSAANCKVLPLPGAAPLCALVATMDLEPGTELVSLSPTLPPSETTSKLDSVLANHLIAKYAGEIQELRDYLAMAYQPPFKPFAADTFRDNRSEPEFYEGIYTDNEQSATIKDSEISTIGKDLFEFPFHTINLDYPGLRYLHRNPDILAIDNFLTDEECDRIIQNAKSHLIPCVIKHPKTGVVQEDPSRSSTNANMPQSDVPSIVDKFVRLANCADASYLETLQILRYTKGQFFHAHTDGFQGPTTACGFEKSGRLVTIFCYLNDVPRGGETRFPRLKSTIRSSSSSATIGNNDSEQDAVLPIAPRKGMAVVHFPSTTGFEEDLRTEHEGSVAIDEKWLLVTWVWKDRRTDPQYADILFPSIMKRPPMSRRQEETAP